MCERQGAVLVALLTRLLLLLLLTALQTREVRDVVENLVRRRGGRRRADYWVAGNDIEKEGRLDYSVAQLNMMSFGNIL